MSWNEPGDEENKGKKKDPWGRQEESPPDLDEIFRKLQVKFREIFFGKSKGGGGSIKVPATGKTFSASLIIGVVAVVYVLSGIYIVAPAEEAVVLRLGRYVGTMLPGPHWIAPGIEKKKVINVLEVKPSKHGGLMLTKDENIVSAEIAVQFRINNARDFLFNLVEPVNSLKQVSESALRAVVGQSTLNEVLTSGRSEIGAEIRKQIQQILNNYQAGIEISDLAMQQTKAPEEVKAAFDDAIKAQQDEERLVNEAQAYSLKIIPIAEGHAKRTLEEAKAYRGQVILQAQGQTEKFAQVLPEYQRAPQITRERLYLDTLQQVYANTPKVLVDVNGGNNLMVLPLEKLISSSGFKRSKPPLSKEEEEVASHDQAPQGIAGLPGRIDVRESYEDAERPSRSGA